MTQIINLVNPTYLYNFILEDSHTTNDVLYSTYLSRPCISIIYFYSIAGYAIIEESAEEQTMRVAEHITADAVICSLEIIHYKAITNVYLVQHPPVVFVVYIIQIG